MSTYSYRYYQSSIELVPNNPLITLNSYLIGADGLPLLLSGALDSFIISTSKVSLPSNPSLYESFFQQLIVDNIANKFNLQTTCDMVSGSNILTLPNTSSVYPGMEVLADSVPSGTTVVSVYDSNRIYISNSATATQTGIEISLSTSTWNIVFNSSGSGNLGYFLSVNNLDQL